MLQYLQTGGHNVMVTVPGEVETQLVFLPVDEIHVLTGDGLDLISPTVCS